MAQNQQTSAQVAAIANKALQNPSSLSDDEIRTLAASVQSQSSGSGQQTAGNNQQGSSNFQANPNQGQGNQQSQRK
jgi:cytochrome c553